MYGVEVVECVEAIHGKDYEDDYLATYRCTGCGVRVQAIDTPNHPCDEDWLLTVPGEGAPARGDVYRIWNRELPEEQLDDCGPVSRGVGVYKCCCCYAEFSGSRLERHLQQCRTWMVLCVVPPTIQGQGLKDNELEARFCVDIVDCYEVAEFSDPSRDKPAWGEEAQFRCTRCGDQFDTGCLTDHCHNRFIQTVRSDEDLSFLNYDVEQVHFFEYGNFDNATVHADAVPVRRETTVAPSAAPSAVPSTMNASPGSGTIASEGPELAISFLGPAGAQALELMDMAGPAIEHIDVAREVFTDTQTPPIKITNMAKRGTIVQTIPYLDSTRWSAAMVSQAKLNELCTGGVLYQMEMHGPATNGGCLRAVWLPYTPTSTTINIARVSQYPFVEMPLGGDHVITMCLLDSKTTPTVRKTSEFFAPFTPQNTCCICIYVDQELNNGYNVGASNELYVSYILRSCFGPYWKMGRALIGKDGEDGLIGRSISSLLGRSGVRLTIGDNNQHWDRNKFPMPDLDLIMPNVNSFNVRQRKTANGTEVNAVITRICLLNGIDGNDDRTLAFMHGVQMAGAPNTSYTLPPNSFSGADSAKVTGSDFSEILYMNTSPTFDEEIVLDFSTSVPIRLRTVRVIADENGAYALCTFQTAPTSVALNDTQSCGLTVVQIRRMLNIFFSAATTYIKAPTGTAWIPGPSAYKSACFVTSVFPGNTTNMYSGVDYALSSALSDLPGRCVVTLANPVEPLQQIPVVFYDGLFALNNPDKYMVTVGLVDDYYISAISAYPTLDLANEVTAPLESYALPSRAMPSYEHAPVDVERAMRTSAWVMYNRRCDPEGCGLPLLKETPDYEMMVWRARNNGVVHSEDDNGTVHSMVASIIAGVASGAGGAAQDAISSRRQQKYALERMLLAHSQSMEQGLQAGKIGLATGLATIKARAAAQYQLDAARMGLDAATVHRTVNSHSYSPGVVQNLRPQSFSTPGQGEAVRSHRVASRRESAVSFAGSRRESGASNVSARNSAGEWGGPPADAGWANEMEGVELPPRDIRVAGVPDDHTVV